MQKLLFIYNPTAGKGAVKSGLAAVVDRFTKAGYLVTAYPTQGKRDATRAARELGAHFDRVVCCGGDGTLSETAAGLVELSRPPVLGYLPAGSTNDCAHNLRLPMNLEQAAAVAAGEGVERPWDVGRLNGRPFIYVAAFGAFTNVAYDTPQDMKNTFGHLAYILAGIGQLPNIAPAHLRVEYGDTVIEDDFLYGMVCNTFSVAGVKALPPDQVVLDDGLFEVLLVKKDIRIEDVAGALQALIRQAPIQGGAVVSFQTDRLTITGERPIPWTLDGEYGGTWEVSRVENCPQALTVIHGK